MTTHEDRVQRAGNWIADAAEGKLVGFDLSLAITTIIGWTDLRPFDVSVNCWPHCKAQYLQLASHLRSIRDQNANC